MTSPDPSESRLTRHAEFHTTRWSMVVAAQGRSSRDAHTSLESLCHQYWPPLYAYVRRHGHARHDAQDLTQEFFAKLLEKDWLAAVERENGRLRTFLMMAMKRFLANEWDRARAQKRGGGVKWVSLDGDDGEILYLNDRAASQPAEWLYDRSWALTLLGTTLRRLRGEHEQAGRLTEYELLKPCLTAARGEIAYESLASAMGMAPASVRSAVHRLRKRFREVFREEVAGTVATMNEVDDEMQALIAALGQI